MGFIQVDTQAKITAIAFLQQKAIVFHQFYLIPQRDDFLVPEEHDLPVKIAEVFYILHGQAWAFFNDSYQRVKTIEKEVGVDLCFQGGQLAFRLVFFQ